jgi:hypothetical protein
MKFDVRLTLDVDEEDNILPTVEDMYEEVITELIQDLIYDIDGATVRRIEVKRR